MRLAITLLGLLISQAKSDMPKNDPNGIWESSAGTRFEMKLTGSELAVQLVPTPEGRYVSYNVALSNKDQETNTYVGKGFFVAKVAGGKECRFDTDWQVIVITSDHIIGSTSSVVPDPATCEAKERSQAQLDLTKK
jgi:hypothetical protein